MTVCASATIKMCYADLASGIGSRESATLVANIISRLGGGTIASALETAEAPNTVMKMGECSSNFVGNINLTCPQCSLRQFMQSQRVILAKPSSTIT
jgi:hypothetical protein